MSNINILVYGWYFNKNIGDDLFIDAFKKLFPEFNFTFTNYITVKQLNSNNAVFFGGGSFLYADIKSEDKELLFSKPIFYIGVGVEDDIHSTHIELMKIAKVIATRSELTFHKVKSINNKTYYIPDIIFCLDKNISYNKIKNSVLVIPNSCVLPKHDDKNWKYASWNYFKSEYAQFLDVLIENNYNIHMFPMCTNHKNHDHLASAEIINSMKYGSYNFMLPEINESIKIIDLFSQYEHIITQRFHGIVLADIVGVNPLTISHHSKLDYSLTNNYRLSYYNCSKAVLLDRFNLTKHNYIDSKIDMQSFSVVLREILKCF